MQCRWIVFLVQFPSVIFNSKSFCLCLTDVHTFTISRCHLQAKPELPTPYPT
uniref:Uncharacterized protein n=1 Tax=Rhizophora mucronata TaxID=61149 RepID=A0A2P2MH47_RHIMU